MNLPSNFDKYKPIIEWMQKTGSNLNLSFANFKELLSFCLNAGVIRGFRWNKDETIFHLSDRDGGMLVDEKLIYDRLAQLTDARIEYILTRYSNQVKLIALQKVIIGNKSNNNKIMVSYVNFQKYCNYYYDVCKDYDVIEFSIDIEFDEEAAKSVSMTVNQGELIRPKTFNSFVQYIKVIGLLGVEF